MADEIIWILTCTERSLGVLITAFALWFFFTLVLIRHYVSSRKEWKPLFYADDPARDFAAWDAEQQRNLDRLPECADCGNPIQDETAFYINCEWICEDCMDFYRRDVVPE